MATVTRMNAPPGILAAPPPGSPPPTAPPAQATTQEERILAAVGYLGYVTGFWLVLPIAIYVLKRERSRFVAHHAMRAILLHLLAVPLLVFGWALAAAVHIGMVFLLDDHGRSPSRGAEAGLFVVMILAWVLPWLVYLCVSVLGAIRAFQGRLHAGSLLGRVVERLLGQDSTVSRQP